MGKPAWEGGEINCDSPDVTASWEGLEKGFVPSAGPETKETGMTPEHVAMQQLINASLWRWRLLRP